MRDQGWREDQGKDTSTSCLSQGLKRNVLSALSLGSLAAQNCPSLAASSVFAYESKQRAQSSGFPLPLAPCPPCSCGQHAAPHLPFPTTLHSLRGKKGETPKTEALCRALPHISEDHCQANTQMIFLGIFIFR